MSHRGPKAFVLLSSIALFASACADAIVSPGATGARTYEETQMERPVFRSGEEMMAVVEKRHGLQPAELARLEQEQKYQSLRAYLDAEEWTEENAGKESDLPTGSEEIALKNDGVLRDDFAFGDGILSVLNRRGEIQVGDTVYKLTRDYVYAVLPENLPLLNEMVPTLSSPAPEREDDRISVTKIETESTEKAEGEEGATASRVLMPTTGPSYFSFNFSATASCTWQSGSRRMKGKAYITNALFYSEAGVKTDWEKKTLWWWSNSNAPGTLSVGYSQWNLKKGGNPVFPNSGSHSWWGASSVGIVITSGWFTVIRGTIDSSHGSPIGWCYNQVNRP
jgi:hypothetical protein